MGDTVQTVITQCELWTGNNDIDDDTNFKGIALKILTKGCIV